MRRIVIMLAFVLVLPVFAWANGPHDSLTCNGCHGIHTAKDNQLIFAVKANTADKASGVSALCLGCHSTKGNGMGIRPVESTHSHPWGVSPNPKRAHVPKEVLRNGKLECVGCHDPHPSNPNYRYLRVDTKNGSQMQNFCALCHASKLGKRTPDSAIFSSMDETNFKEKPAAAPAPAKRTSKK
jgi:predicted CXXCH cytochrome family protein